jgi:glycosyltransferase involved in cell wall biosynthesis
VAELFKELMNILFHLTSPAPAIAETDAAFQEVAALQRRFGGSTINLFPLPRPSRFFPRPLYGVHRLSELRKLDATVDVHHVYHAQLSIFPVLRRLKKPIVYSVIAGLQNQSMPAALSKIRAVVISNSRDEAVLKKWGATNYRIIRPGIDLSHFSHQSVPRASDFTLMAGSAPWVPEQFRQKGIDALLDAARELRNLKLVFLWRGLLLEPLKARIASVGLASRVEIINEKADVNAVLARCHAAVVLAENSKLVKAWPHSLIESLAAGKPVLISDTIPMSDYVRENACGEIVGGIDPTSVRQGIQKLMDGYARLQPAALEIGRRDFDQERMVKEFGELYRDIT